MLKAELELLLELLLCPSAASNPGGSRARPPLSVPMGSREDPALLGVLYLHKSTQRCLSTQKNPPKNASPGSTGQGATSSTTEQRSGPGGQRKNDIKFQPPLEIPGAITEAEKDYLGNWEAAQDPHWQCRAILIIISGPDLHGWRKLLLL